MHAPDPAPTPRFDGDAVVLTGVGRKGQVGEFVARAFAERGAHVVLLDRQGVESGERARELREAGLGAEARACDLTDGASLAVVAGAIREAHPDGLAALVNMAGGFTMSGPLPESDPEVWHRMIAINLTTAYLATRAFLPLLRQKQGAAVFFSSVAALPGGRVASMSAYATAKSGVITLTRAVADEERDSGVRANAVAPSSIRTAANMESMGADARYVERETVAETVMFLCSQAARGITGQVIRLG